MVLHFIADASARGQGIGKSILEDLLDRPQVQSPVILTTVTESKGFYLKYGFEEIRSFDGIPLCVSRTDSARVPVTMFYILGE